MKKYQVLDHVADVRLLVQGTSLQELFNAALEGMASIICNNISPDKSDISVTISLSADDATMLLIDFLSTILTNIHTHKAIFYKATFDLITEKNIKVTIYGYQVEKFDTDIKAVTYHEANIQKNNNGIYATTIVFDI